MARCNLSFSLRKELKFSTSSESLEANLVCGNEFKLLFNSLIEFRKSIFLRNEETFMRMQVFFNYKLFRRCGYSEMFGARYGLQLTSFCEYFKSFSISSVINPKLLLFQQLHGFNIKFMRNFLGSLCSGYTSCYLSKVS